MLIQGERKEVITFVDWFWNSFSNGMHGTPYWYIWCIAYHTGIDTWYGEHIDRVSICETITRARYTNIVPRRYQYEVRCTSSESWAEHFHGANRLHGRNVEECTLSICIIRYILFLLAEQILLLLLLLLLILMQLTVVYFKQELLPQETCKSIIFVSWLSLGKHVISSFEGHFPEFWPSHVSILGSGRGVSVLSFCPSIVLSPSLYSHWTSSFDLETYGQLQMRSLLESTLLVSTLTTSLLRTFSPYCPDLLLTILAPPLVIL